MADFMNEGNSRYTGFPSAEKYEQADYDLAYKKYQERFANAGDFHFYFVGNVDEKKLAEYAMTNRLVEEPAFKWWVPQTLRWRNHIFAKVKN